MTLGDNWGCVNKMRREKNDKIYYNEFLLKAFLSWWYLWIPHDMTHRHTHIFSIAHTHSYRIILGITHLWNSTIKPSA